MADGRTTVPPVDGAGERPAPAGSPHEPEYVNARFGLVLLLLLTIFLVEGFSNDISELVVVVLVLALTTATFRLTAVTANLPTFVVFVGLAVLALVLGATTEPLDDLRAVGYLALFALMTGLGFALLLGVLRQRAVDARTVMGAIATYVVVGLSFSWLFQAIAVWDPDQFTIAPEDSAEFSEFSFITLTTVGFGNDYPTGALAGRLVVLEALFAQLFLATFIARLVGMYGRSAPEAKRAAPSQPDDAADDDAGAS